MLISATWTLRCFGISGIIGSIIFICGDLLYNHIPGSSASPVVKMSRLPQSRLLNAGTVGLIGCWFYTLAAMHLYLAFRPAGEIFAFILLFAFNSVMIGYGIGHTAYFAIAAAAQVAAQTGSNVEEGGKMGNTLFQRLIYITFLPVVISNLMMLYGIGTGRSLYPRWMIVFIPILIYLLKTPVVRVLKGRIRELINVSYDNVVLFIFYLISTVVLWNATVI
jgi:hypothetical protein